MRATVEELRQQAKSAHDKWYALNEEANEAQLRAERAYDDYVEWARLVSEREGES